MSRFRVAFGASIVAASAALSAQNPTFTSRVEVVRIDALVTDISGKPIAGLTPADFEVVDNGVPQHVDLVLAEQLPLNVVLALDLSGSVAGEQAAQLRTGRIAQRHREIFRSSHSTATASRSRSWLRRPTSGTP